MAFLEEIKINCENWYWSRQVQLRLHDKVEATWGQRIAMPWNLRRKWLILGKNSETNKYYFMWSDEDSFNACPAREASAKYLAKLLDGLTYSEAKSVIDHSGNYR